MTPNGTCDVAVVGLGPAGRALAHRSLSAGLSVLAIDPAPQRPWRQTLAGWTAQLPPWLPREAVGAVADDPVIRADPSAESSAECGAGSGYPVRARYGVLDNSALAAALPLSGARIEARAITDTELAQLPARVVVDARGSRPVGLGRSHRREGRNGDGAVNGVLNGVPLQRAFGVMVEPHVAAPVLDGAGAVLMDWRPHDGATAWGERSPTFLYVIPLPDSRVLLEETCLVGRPGPDHTQLRHRLEQRLLRYGIGRSVIEGAGHERVTVPMLRAPRTGAAWSFGAAGAQHNPITGYSVFASLAAVDGVVARIAQAVRDGHRTPRSQLGRRPAGGPPLIRRAALRALLRLGPDDTMALFDAFGRLPARRQQQVLDAGATTPEVARALYAQFRRLPPRSATALIRASLV